jgi:hypothetical protein
MQWEAYHAELDPVAERLAHTRSRLEHARCLERGERSPAYLSALERLETAKNDPYWGRRGQVSPDEDSAWEEIDRIRAEETRIIEGSRGLPDEIAEMQKQIGQIKSRHLEAG